MEEACQVKLWSPSENLSPRVKKLRDEYFSYPHRRFRNTVLAYTTGAPWDRVYRNYEDYVVPEMVPFMTGIADSLLALAQPVDLPPDFFSQPLIVRRALFTQAVLRAIPIDILEGELIVGGRFNTAMSTCLNQEETQAFEGIYQEYCAKTERLINLGISNCGAVGCHIIQDFKRLLAVGFRGVEAQAQRLSEETMDPDKKAFYQAIIISCQAAKEFAGRYAAEARRQAQALANADPARCQELETIAAICDRVPYEPPQTFYEAVQACWFIHMIDMIAEGYHGAGLSYGRFDQYLYPFYARDLAEGRITRDQAKEILQCFFIKHNYAYDRQPCNGKQGINSGYGQLITLGGMGPGGVDLTNDLTYLVLEVIMDMNLLEPKCTFRLHQGTPDLLFKRLLKAIQQAQGSPFLLNFDEPSILGLEKEGISPEEAVDYGVVGCVENTSAGNDISGTVDVNINIAKAVELALNNGRCLLTGQQIGPATGDPATFSSFEEFLAAYQAQLQAIIQPTLEVASAWDGLRATYVPVPYLSATIGGCLEKGRDVRAGGAKYNFITVEGVGIATAADSVTAIKKLVFDEKRLTMEELVAALRTNFEGKEALRQLLLNRAPKMGNDDHYADAIAREISRFWGHEVKKHVSPLTGRRYMGGYLSWNYFVGMGAVTAATPDGRKNGEPLSNAVAPAQGRDVNGPTAAMKSVTQLGFDAQPRGVSYTITFNPAMLQTEAQLAKLGALLKAYGQLGGTSIQLNLIDRETLIEAQQNPEKYQNLLVRVTGYNAYFVTLGRGMQDEIIARTTHAV